jgi:hypothetical protein
LVNNLESWTQYKIAATQVTDISKVQGHSGDVAMEILISHVLQNIFGKKWKKKIGINFQSYLGVSTWK